MLANNLAEWLVSVQDLGVEASVFVTIQIFLAFEGVLRVGDVVELCEGLGSFAVIEARNNVGRFFWSLLLHVNVLTLADSAVAMHREEGLVLCCG